MFVSPLFSQFSGGGKGTKSEPYLLKSKQDLMNIRDTFAVGKHYKLCNNIRDSLREPIPRFENSTFDGAGFKITLAIVRDDSTGKNNYSFINFIGSMSN